MPDPIQPPEEAVEAAYQAFFDRPHQGALLAATSKLRIQDALIAALPAIYADLREPLKAATSAMAAISAATGRARLMQENPDLDGFTVDEELDEISSQVNALRESLAALDSTMKGGGDD